MKTLNVKAILSLVFSGLLLTACGDKPNESVTTDSTASAGDMKTYLVGMEASFPPFEWVDESGKIVGFDVDLMTAIGEKAGFKVAFRNLPWEGIFTALEQGDVDILMSGITITDERKQSIDFSTSYFDTSNQIAVKGDVAITSYADLKMKKVGVQTGSTGDEIAQAILGKGNNNIKRFDSVTVAIKELAAGGVDAVVADDAIIANYIKNNDAAGIRLVKDNSAELASMGIALKKGKNPELQASINEALAALKADGTYDQIKSKYFAE
jgi:polar amino acid transport system substrate-binding protein